MLLKENQTMKTILLLTVAAICALSFPACSTTKDANGNSTTSFDVNSPAAQAAIAAATSIAIAAANAAVSKYLGPTKARVSLSAASPAMAAAEISTEQVITKKYPSLPAATIHNITVKAYQDRVSNAVNSP